MNRAMRWNTAAAFLILGWLAAFATPAVQAQDAAVEHAKSLSRAFRAAAFKASPSVVTILAHSRGRAADPTALRDLLRDPRFRELFPDGLPPEEEVEPPAEGEEPEFQSGVGSGVIIDETGVILTNNHVVQGASRVLVRLSDGRELEASDIKTDPLSDLAVLRVRAEAALPAAELGDSDELEIGDWVIAIGSPFELEATVSAGIISGKGRSIRQIQRGSLIQTDAAINPGNSGGPLVNLQGQVVGLNTAIASNSGGYQGIGFAIPVNRAKWAAKELLTRGMVRRAYLGIRSAGDAIERCDCELRRRPGAQPARFAGCRGAKAD